MRRSFTSNPRAWRILLACYWLTLFVLTHIPMTSVVRRVTTADKVAHVVAFAILAAVLATTWQLSAGRLSLPQLGWAWLVVVVFAAFDEWTQSFVGRQADIVDWIADAAGAAVGLAVFVWFRRSIEARGRGENADAT